MPIRGLVKMSVHFAIFFFFLKFMWNQVVLHESFLTWISDFVFVLVLFHFFGFCFWIELKSSQVKIQKKIAALISFIFFLNAQYIAT